VDQAIGAAIGGAVLSFIALPPRAEVGQIPQEKLTQIALWDGLMAAVPGLVAVVLYSRCRVSLESYRTTRDALAARKPAE
jgi:hypothetical protein